MMTTTASLKGRDTDQPTTFLEWDLLLPKDRGRTPEYLTDIDPDFLFIAPPRGSWSQMQAMRQANPHQCRELRRKQAEARPLLVFVEELVQWQVARSSAVAMENPAAAKRWKEALMEAAFSRRDVSQALAGVCAFGFAA